MGIINFNSTHFKICLKYSTDIMTPNGRKWLKSQKVNNSNMVLLAENGNIFYQHLMHSLQRYR